MKALRRQLTKPLINLDLTPVVCRFIKLIVNKTIEMGVWSYNIKFKEDINISKYLGLFGTKTDRELKQKSTRVIPTWTILTFYRFW